MVRIVEPLADQMFHSLHRFDELPDGGAVNPTHGAGSFCSSPSILNTCEGDSEVSVFDGGPDTWSTATAVDLEVGP